MVKEKPILFSGPMVRAILEGRKTQTRRIIKPQPSHEAQHYSKQPDGQRYCFWPNEADLFKCPYQVGDILWVRETILYKDSPEAWMYAADNAPVAGEGRLKHKPVPSMFMPRWACRIRLEVTEVRCQRLQDITEEDAKAEGAQPWPHIDVCCSHIGGFANIIDQINGPMTWRANPWVWAYSLRRIR